MSFRNIKYIYITKTLFANTLLTNAAFGAPVEQVKFGLSTGEAYFASWDLVVKLLVE